MAERPVASGLRDRRITIQQLTESVGDSGFPMETWAPLCDVWANRQDAIGVRIGESFEDGQLSAVAGVRWEFPYRADVDPERVAVPKTRRVLYEGRVYDITAAQPIGRRRTIALRTIAKADA